MKHLILSLIVIFITSCDSDVIYEPPKMEGLWVRLLPPEPSWNYHFCDGTLTQFVVKLGDTVDIREFPYTQREHILHIGDTPDNQRLWSLEFLSDTVCQVKDITPGNSISYTMLLGKKK